MQKQQHWPLKLFWLPLLAWLALPSALHAQEPTVTLPNQLYLPLISNVTGNAVTAERLVGNTGDPNYVFTPEEVQRLAAKEAAAQAHFDEKFSHPTDVTAAAARSKELTVGTWKEPNTDAYNNYCGPGATQVALDVRLDAAKVKDIDKLASAEGTIPTWGTSMNRICPVLNTELGTNWYHYDSTTTQNNLMIKIIQDIDTNYGFVTGVVTFRNGFEMNGWQHNANHIITVYGFANADVQNGTYSGDVKYTETSSPRAGYSGPYRQIVSLARFWKYVELNSYQCW